MALLLIELGSEAMELLSILRLLVAFPGQALSFALLVVKSLSMLLLPPLNISKEFSGCDSRGILGELLVLRL